MTTGGITTTATMQHHAAHDLEEEEDNDSFASSIASYPESSGEGGNPNKNADDEEFVDAQDVAVQGAPVSDFNTMEIEASQTKLIIAAVDKLEMDSVQNKDVDATGEDNQAGVQDEPRAEDEVNEEQIAYDLKQDTIFHT